ncbi:MAG: HpcH/HpaI aldolase/citrate lyase family protein [Anaerolineae bacterium]
MPDKVVGQAETQREVVLREALAFNADLPLKYLRQQAQYTTPASNYKLANGAASRGFAPVVKILDKVGIGLDDLAETLGVSQTAVEELLAADPHAPLVMIDGEDAQALDEEVVQRGRDNAVRVFLEADWGRTLRFYRPSGLRLPYCVMDLVSVLTGVAGCSQSGNYSIDGIIFPKVEQPAEIAWLCEVLSRIETQLGLPENHIKVQVLVESGWSVVNLPEIVRRALPRLTGIIFGIADYSADLALPAIRYDHFVCDWARAQVVNMAGAVGVPAIDAMTVNYPVADPALTAEENRDRILARLKACYDDAIHSIDMGMKGKWVGHPAQLFVVLLAYRTHVSAVTMKAELDKIIAYQKAVQEKIGAIIIDGVMSDRATDRHARARLREGVALGLLSPEEGLALGVISAAEAAELGAGET